MTTSFWGLVVEPNKLYSQIVPAGFKLSMASLGPQEESTDSNSTASPSSNKKQTKSSTTTLMVRMDEKDDYALCSLTTGQLNQQPLDLVFTEGENIAIRVVGDQAVHLTGYYLPDECHDHDMDSDDEYDEDEDELDSEDFDSEDSEVDSEEEERIKEITSDEEEEEESFDDEMSDDLSEEEEEEVPPPKKRAVQVKEEEVKKAKVESKKESPKPNPQPTKKPEQSKKDSPKPVKNTESKPENVKSEETKKPEVKQTEKKILPNGLIIEDIKVGDGIKAQQGRRVGITYKGTLLSNGKTFDTNKGKPLFYFTLGKGEVIKGMEQGVQGMALGGERRITIPSTLGYGPKGAPPAIPGDATLVFEIKLDKVTNNNGK